MNALLRTTASFTLVVAFVVPAAAKPTPQLNLNAPGLKSSVSGDPTVAVLSNDVGPGKVEVALEVIGGAAALAGVSLVVYSIVRAFRVAC